MKILHYVYPDRYYDYYARENHKIVVNNEVALFRFDALNDVNTDKYHRKTRYFLFTHSLRVNIREYINKGKAEGLTCAEARIMHDYLLRRGMLCVYSGIVKEYSPRLYKKLTSMLEESKERQTPASIIDRALSLKKKERIPTSTNYDLQHLANQFLESLFAYPVYLEEVPHPKRERDYEYEERESKRPRY